jgi:hypothetical protein
MAFQKAERRNSMARITTVQDRKDGSVWTGREVDTSTPFTDAAVGLITGGLTLAAQALSGDDGTRTVEVNGHRHTGRKVDK